MSFHVAPLEICLTDWLNSTISIVRQSFAVPFVETVHLSLFLWFVEYIGFFPIDSSKLAESKNCKIVIFVYCFLYCILYDLFPFFFFTFDLLDVIKNHHEMTNSIQVPFQFYLTFCHCPFHCVIKNLRITIFTYNSSSSSSNNDILSQLFPAGNRKNHHRQQQQFQRNERERTKNVENFLHNFQPKLNFHSLSNSIHSISALKDKYRIKNTRIPSQYNFQLRTSKSPSFRLLATILFTYSYRDRQINNSKRENTREKREFSFRRPIKIHHSRSPKTVWEQRLPSADRHVAISVPFKPRSPGFQARNIDSQFGSGRKKNGKPLPLPLRDSSPPPPFGACPRSLFHVSSISTSLIRDTASPSPSSTLALCLRSAGAFFLALSSLLPLATLMRISIEYLLPARISNRSLILFSFSNFLFIYF